MRPDGFDELQLQLQSQRSHLINFDRAFSTRAKSILFLVITHLKDSQRLIQVYEHIYCELDVCSAVRDMLV